MANKYPARERGRDRWILETLRNHQGLVIDILDALLSEEGIKGVRDLLNDLNRMDRDGFLARGGLFTDHQLGLLMETDEEKRANQAEMREER